MAHSQPTGERSDLMKQRGDKDWLPLIALTILSLIVGGVILAALVSAGFRTLIITVILLLGLLV